ncbi:MAG TPA: VOC family protein [Anaerolineales bacterium]|nr:VOC family protein [Anaerolineales bacterium]
MKLLEQVNVVSLCVTNLSRARDFYSQTLGLGPPWFDDEQLGWVEWGQRGQNGNLAVTLAREDIRPGGGTTPVLNTADCQILFTELKKRGVRCDEPVVIPGLLMYCTFYDPDGNRLQAISDPLDQDGSKMGDARLG